MGVARIDRSQLGLLGALLALTVAAWLVTNARMGDMESTPGIDLGSLGFYASVWIVMMAAMMLPSVAPTVLTYDRRRTTADATAFFVAGYLCVWTAAGLAAYVLFEIVRSIDPSFLAWDDAGRYLTGGVIMTAAGYQLTPLKRSWLGKCRSPMIFVTERWRPGRTGGLELGARYGAWCFGCCWALMAALFAVGLMSLGWMALIAAAIAGERLLPWPAAARRTVAVFLLALGLGVAFVPGEVPGFSEPKQGSGMEMTR